MAYLVGIDEAGYGPNLGPLVVSATVWRVASLEFNELPSAGSAEGFVFGRRVSSGEMDGNNNYGPSDRQAVG